MAINQVAGQLQNPLGDVRFQRDYLWSVLLPDMPGVSGVDVGQLIQSIQFGDYSIETPTVMRVGSFQASFAGLLTVPNLQMSFLKTSPDIVSEYFNTWKLYIIDKQGLFHPKNDYQRNIYVRFLDSSGLAFAQYKFIGAFPNKFPTYQSLDYASNTVTKVLMWFTVDKVEYETFA